MHISVICLFADSKLRAKCYLRKYYSEIALMITFRTSAKVVHCFPPETEPKGRVYCST